MKNEKSKSIASKAKEYFSKLLGFDTTMIETADGKQISIDCANGTEPAVGDYVKDDAGNSMPDATIALKDGRTITTDASGNVADIAPAVQNQPPVAAAAPAAAAPVAQAAPATAVTLESLQAEKTAWEAKELQLQKERDEAVQELSDLQAAFEKTNTQLEFIVKNAPSGMKLENGRLSFAHTPTTAKMTKDERKKIIKGETAAASVK